MNRKPVVCGLAIHPPSLAGTRLRVTQFFPRFEEEGLECHLWTFLRDEDLASWFGASQLRRVLVVLRALCRIPRALRLIARARVVVVHRECIPFGPPALEWFASRGGRALIWDVDDFVWHSYTSPTAGRITRWIRTSNRKHAATARRAREVWAGSEAIKEWAEAHSRNVVYVPTVVDVPATRPHDARSADCVWVGSHSTAKYLELVLPVLAKVPEVGSIVVVGGTVSPHPGSPPLRELPWSLETERRVCETARVGLYPVDADDPWTEGKCGLKAILYMAHGLPCVVTPTRPNAAIVRDGVDGIHAASIDEWPDAVARLLTDDELWESCSREGHARALSEFSLQTWAPVLARRVRNLAG